MPIYHFLKRERDAAEKGKPPLNALPKENGGDRVYDVTMEEDENDISLFQPFTRESMFNIQQKIAENMAAKAAEKEAAEEGEEEFHHDDDLLKPNPKFIIGKKLPLAMQDEFPPECIGKPIEDIDEYYDDKMVFCVCGKDYSIYRFSATNALYILSPFNPLRQLSVYILVHPIFSLCVILTIIVNCVFMAMTENPFPWIDYVFTGIYTVEAFIKITSRGFIVCDFTYLRDPWNWLDFAVISLAYVTMFIDLGNLSALRTFRVLRALKTVAVIPGLKTIVGALLEAVRRLRDVMILTVFMLSIFALVGMQLYMGGLRNKCVQDIDLTNMTEQEIEDYRQNDEHWYKKNGEFLMCGNSTGAGDCPKNHTCIPYLHSNPNYNYTSFDHFGVALLCTFRLMTQDYWENLYMLILRSYGPWHCLYFMIVILLGSFYLVNLILAIVAMSYEEQQKQDQADADEASEELKEEENRRGQKIIMETIVEVMNKTPSEHSCKSLPASDDLDDEKERVSMQSEKHSFSEITPQPVKKDYDSDREGEKKDLPNNRSPSVTKVDMKDVSVIKELLETASGHRGSFVSGMSEQELPLKDKLYIKFCSWTCCPCWQMFQKIVAFFILDAFVDLFITICILVNTAFMALDQYNMSKELEEVLTNGNYVFTGIFAAEAFLKIIALNPVNYLKDGWNCFDIVIVFLSFLELALDGVSGLSVLRSFRLLRVFKLAKSWSTLNMLITIVASTVGALGNLTIVLGIVVFIFAVMGQQLFADKYTSHYGPNGTYSDEDLPRWNFTDFIHSFMIVFRVLCGEWIESMWGCRRVAGWPCIPFFLLTMVIGNLVVLNLFLACLLSAFGAESLQGTSTDDAEAPNKLAEAISRFQRFGVWVKVNLIVCVKVSTQRRSKPPILPVISPSPSHPNGKDSNIDGPTVIGNGKVWDSEGQPTPTATEPTGDDTLVDYIATDKHSETSTRPASRASTLRSHKGSDASSSESNSTLSDDANERLNKVDAEGEPEINEVALEYTNDPEDCWCQIVRKKCPWCIRLENTDAGKKWWEIRCKAFWIVEHKYFETFIIIMIMASSLALAIEDVYLNERPILKEILYYMDKMFTTVFILEMLIKWVAFGYKKYFTDAWCWLDFVIVLISIVMLIAEAMKITDVGAFKAMRTLRALRPLRAISRWEGMRVVVNALIKAIPSIFNVLLVCLVFWLIFGIVGVQFFSGKFFKCLDHEGNYLSRNIVDTRNSCEVQGYNWTNSNINFDNVLNAYLALFQVATYKGWTMIMDDAIDIVGDEQQPERETSIGYYLYFVFFIIFGSFFTLNLFIGVIIENFNQQKKKAGGSLEMFMTEDQKKYYTAMKRMQSKAPQKSIPKPSFKPAALIFDMTSNQLFDICIMAVIMLNMVTMALEHYEQSELFTDILYYINMSFIVIFTVECMLKIIGLRLYYFKIPWNIFDFVVVVLSILGLALADAMEAFFVSPTLLRVVRVFRVGRVLRLVKSAKGIRTLLFSLAVSLPALFNIGLLLFLVCFIYATFGMSFFMRVKHTGGLDDCFNFETFGRSIIYLFQMCTSAGWDSALAGLSNEKDCEGDNCGKYGIAVFYLVTYLVISFLVVVNMYIAVILENFSQATEDVQQGLTTDDFDMYYEKWEKFDPDATQFLSLDRLSDFVDYLEEPLRLPKPNHFLLVKLDIPICEGDKCYCRDILDALTKNFLGTSDTGDIPEDAGKPAEKIEYNPISSTLMRQKEHYAARIIQKAYRQYRRLRGELSAPPMPYEEAVATTQPQENSISQGSSENGDIKKTETEQDKKEKDKEETEKEKKSEEEKENASEKDENEIEILTPSTEQKTVELRPDSDVVA